MGVSASRWITTHGFAINVAPNLQYFDTSIIIPCGIDKQHYGVTSMEQILLLNQHDAHAQAVPSMQDVATIVLQNIQEIFQIDELTPGITLT